MSLYFMLVQCYNNHMDTQHLPYQKDGISDTESNSELNEQSAEELRRVCAELQQWKAVFGHLGTADECGNVWIKLQEENQILKDLCKRSYQVLDDDAFPILRCEIEHFVKMED